MTTWGQLRTATVRLRAMRWGLVVAGAFGVCCVLRASLERNLSASLFEVGTALGQALHVAPNEPAVDWEALERDVAASEPSNVGLLELQATTPAADEKSTNAGASKEQRSPSKAKGTKGVYVSADQVLRLSRSAKVPASRFVVPKGERPAGLQVAGVSGLGIGVRDGDVLTRVAGAEVKSSAAVISTVLQLRAKRAPAISGEFWRGQERFQIVFQMPYPSPGTTASGSAASSPLPPVSAAASGGSSVASN